MPVSKKRKKHSAKREPKKQKHVLLHREKDGEPTDVIPFLLYHPFENSKSKINVVYRSGEPCVVKSKHLDEYAFGSEERIIKVRDYMESVFNDYLSTTSDLDQFLNIWSSLSDTTVADTLDFTEYTSNAYAENIDAAENVYDMINDPDIKLDVSWLWSTSQYFNIIASPRVMYKVQRLWYDESLKAVTYAFVGYERFILAKDINLTIPITQGAMNIYFEKCHVGGDDMLRMEYNPQLPYIGDFYENNYNYMKDVADACVKKYGNGFITVRTDLIGQCFVDTIFTHERKQIKANMDIKRSKLYNPFVDIMSDYILKDIDEAEQNKDYNAYHTMRAASTIASALIISNKLLKDKKLSKPVKDYGIPKYVANGHQMDIRDLPERKTRILGSNIKIASVERPATPTVERVMRCHTLEWGRREHLRRLKSGKIVHVKAARCTRKCVDKAGVKASSAERATDYKIKPEQKI